MKDLNVQNIDAVFVCIGGGGLISGISTYIKSKNPKTKVFGCSAKLTPAMYECMKANEIVTIKSYPSIADGNGGNIEKGSITYDICQKNLEEIILVEEDDIKLATRVFLENERALIEPTTAVSLAGYMKVHKQFKGKNVVIVTCGRNVTMPTLNKILEETKHMKIKK
jgi:threonine dehydratase